jgi:hypothetical protein
MTHLERKTMLSIRAACATVAVAAVAAAVPAGALAAPLGDVQAHAAGTDATVLTYPSIVSTRLQRAQAALDKAAKYADQGVPDKAISSLAAARNNLTKAWTGAKYVIETAPPPVATEDALHRGAFLPSGRLRIAKTPKKVKHTRKHRKHGRKRAHKAQVVPAAGAVPATIYDTGFAVFSLQHYAATIAVSLVDDSSGSQLLAVRSTLARALNDRDAAIEYVHSIDVPPPAEEARYKGARAAQEEDAVPAWGTTMPNVTTELDDEIQQVEGTIATAQLTGAQKSILDGADLRDLKTKTTLNTYWPPLPAED